MNIQRTNGVSWWLWQMQFKGGGSAFRIQKLMYLVWNFVSYGNCEYFAIAVSILFKGRRLACMVAVSKLVVDFSSGACAGRAGERTRDDFFQWQPWRASKKSSELGMQRAITQSAAYVRASHMILFIWSSLGPTRRISAARLRMFSLFVYSGEELFQKCRKGLPSKLCSWSHWSYIRYWI